MSHTTRIHKALKLSIKSIAIMALVSPVFAGPVNINKADAITLAKELKGVGEKRAAAIIAYRNENGAFSNAEELQQVRGIGVVVVNENAKNILVK